MCFFAGFIDEGLAATILLVVTDQTKAPLEPDAAPTWRLYGVNGLVAAGNGSASSFETGTVTGATHATPIVVTSAGHGLTVGQTVTVSGVGGNTAANGEWVVSAVTADTFTLSGSAGNANYTSGGAWKTTGLYAVSLSGSVLSSLEAGKTYSLHVNWLQGGNPHTGLITFTVR